MEDILKYVLVGVVLIVAFIRQTRKETQKKQTSLPPFMPQSETPSSPLPDKQKDRTYDGYIPEGPAPEPVEPPKPRKPRTRPNFATPSAKERPRQSTPVTPPPPAATPDTGDDASDYSIRSAEEARRAIIWGEILNRKY